MIGTPKFLSITLRKPSFFQDEPIEGKIELNITAQTVIGDISLSVFPLGSWIKSSSAQKGETIRENLLTYNLNINKLLNINFNFYFFIYLDTNVRSIDKINRD